MKSRQNPEVLELAVDCSVWWVPLTSFLGEHCGCRAQSHPILYLVCLQSLPSPGSSFSWEMDSLLWSIVSPSSWRSRQVAEAGRLGVRGRCDFLLVIMSSGKVTETWWSQVWGLVTPGPPGGQYIPGIFIWLTAYLVSTRNQGQGQALSFLFFVLLWTQETNLGRLLQWAPCLLASRGFWSWKALGREEREERMEQEGQSWCDLTKQAHLSL